MEFCIGTTQAGLFLQLVGVIIILAAQAVFIFRARRRYRRVKGAFLDMVLSRVGPDKEVWNMTEAEVNDSIKLHPLAGFLWDDFWVSLLGLVLTFLGLVVEIV